MSEIFIMSMTYILRKPRIILNLTYKTNTTSNPQYTTYTILDKHNLKYVIKKIWHTK
jgi:hypothetical protein